MSFGFPQGTLSYSGAATDPYWTSVVLQALNESGADAGTTFLDQSNSAHTITANGNFQWDTAQFPTGQSSAGLGDGTGDFLTAPDHANFDLGSGDHHFGCWVRFPNFDAYYGLNAKRVGIGVFSPFSLQTDITTGKVRLVYSTSGSAWDLDITTTSALSVNTWHYVDYNRAGTAIEVAIDGTVGASGTLSGALMVNTAAVSIGAYGDSGSNASINGWMCSARLTKGQARDHTVPTLPYPTS